MNKDWWKTANIYQVYLRSFNDTNNDGIGDINGITEKLEYIKQLGIDTIWISPHYDSPMDDNGYDVRDFYKVSPDYGNIEDFKNLLSKAHSMGMKVLTDLVLNHTSDEHIWFKKARNPEDPEFAKYHDYYIWQPPKIDESGNRTYPTRWVSWFGGPTWTYNEATNEYYLHIFSKKMPDLNWHNENMKNELKKAIKYWIDLGVDGFRVDASNHLEKNWDFPDGKPGFENFSGLPKHHEYLQELGKEFFVPYNLLAIGESGGATKEAALKYVGYGSNEFNLLIHFGHCWIDVDGPTKWFKGPLHLHKIKESYDHWYKMLYHKGWNLIYWHNHDQPRVLSHYGNDKEYHNKSARMLGIALYFMPGTSITYQGEEIGMTNLLFENLEDFRDVEVFTEYKNMIEQGLSHEKVMQNIRDRSRDNARSPMQWDATKNAGFSKHTPWMKVNYNYEKINVLNQDKQADSILNTYRYILNKRHEDKDNIICGEIEFIDIDSDESYMYINRGITRDYLIVSNITADKITIDLKDLELDGFKYLYGNYQEREVQEKMLLEPYEANIFTKEKQ